MSNEAKTKRHSQFRTETARRFPYSARRKSILGDGAYALVLKCQKPWGVLLFESRAQRDEAARNWQQHCQYRSCGGTEHERIDLGVPEAPVPVIAHTAFADRFPDKYERD